MARVAISGRMNRGHLQTEAAAGSRDTACDLAAIGDQDLVDSLHVRTAVPAQGIDASPPGAANEECVGKFSF
jgi:hypothetical protein